jgi:hypothetical protein
MTSILLARGAHARSARKNRFSLVKCCLFCNDERCFEIDDFAILSLARLTYAICQQSVK